MNDEAAQHTETSRQAPLLPPSEFSKDKFEVSFQPITPPQDTAEQAEERRLYNAEHPEHAKLLKLGGIQALADEVNRKTRVAILDQLIAQTFSEALPAGQELKQGCRYVTRDGRITPPLLWWTKEHPLNGPPMFVARFADGLVPYYGNGRCVMPADRAGSDLVAEAKQASCLAQEETWGVRMNREIEARYGPDSLAAGPEETSDEGQLAEENQQTEQNETMQNETTSEYQSVALEVLMPISSNAEVKFPVSARKLHQFMEIGKDFSTWITSRVKQFKLVEGKDFEVSPNFGENPQGGRPSTEYWLTLEMAKYLSMLERNERGDEARRYFIRCEEQLTALQRPHRQLTHGDLARMILEEESAKLAALAGKEQAHKAMGHLVITVGARLQEQDAVIAEVGSRLMSCGRGWKIVR